MIPIPKFTYKQKIELYQEALKTFRFRGPMKGPWVCNTLADLVRERYGIKISDSTAFCKEAFPEFYEELEEYDLSLYHPHYHRPAFPETEEGNQMRETALRRAITKCEVYAGLIPSVQAYATFPGKWPHVHASDFIFHDFTQNKKYKMKDEQLEQGKRLSDEIKYLQEKIKVWEEATEFATDTIQLQHGQYNRSSYGKMPPNVFPVVKEIALGHFKAQLYDLQKQFEAL
jgi:hypothetical protein